MAPPPAPIALRLLFVRHESAQMVSRRLGVDYEIVEALREYDVGSFEGTSDAANWDSYEQVLRGWLLDGKTNLRTGGGESLEEIRERFAGFIFALPTLFPDGGDIVLLAHGGLFRCALPYVLANVSARYSFANVLDHVSWILAEFRDGELFCRQWADTEVDVSGYLDAKADL